MTETKKGPIKPSDIYFYKDIAKVFDVHEKTIYRKIKDAKEQFPDKEILFRRIGSKWYCFEEDLREVLELISIVSQNDREDPSLTDEELKLAEEGYDRMVQEHTDILRGK